MQWFLCVFLWNDSFFFILTCDCIIREVKAGQTALETGEAKSGDLTYFNRTIVILLHLVCLLTKLIPHLEKDKVGYIELSGKSCSHLSELETERWLLVSVLWNCLPTSPMLYSAERVHLRSLCLHTSEIFLYLHLLWDTCNIDRVPLNSKPVLQPTTIST